MNVQHYSSELAVSKQPHSELLAVDHKDKPQTNLGENGKVGGRGLIQVPTARKRGKEEVVPGHRMEAGIRSASPF